MMIYIIIYISVIIVTIIGCALINKEFYGYDLLLCLIWPITYIALIGMGITNQFKKWSSKRRVTYQDPWEESIDNAIIDVRNKRMIKKVKEFKFGR